VIDHNGASMHILDAIGNTSLVRLRNVVPPSSAGVLVKLEWENPTGSVKDRMAHAVLSRAEQDGRLRPGDRVGEYTGGSTGALRGRRPCLQELRQAPMSSLRFRSPSDWDLQPQWSR
jgi:hypothetical protein